MINGEYANGAEVEAYIDNSMVASAIVGAIQPNYYLIHVPGKFGDLIQFKINGRNTENELQEWVLGSHRLDLTINVSIKESKPKTSHTSGFIGTCEPNWECTGWSECSNGFRTRNCHDTNNCAYSYNKPIEKTDCETTSTLERVTLTGEPSEEGFFSRITGAVIGGVTNFAKSGTGAFVFVILIVGATGLVLIRLHKLRKR